MYYSYIATHHIMIYTFYKISLDGKHFDLINYKSMNSY